MVSHSFNKPRNVWAWSPVVVIFSPKTLVDTQAQHQHYRYSSSSWCWCWFVFGPTQNHFLFMVYFKEAYSIVIISNLIQCFQKLRTCPIGFAISPKPKLLITIIQSIGHLFNVKINATNNVYVPLIIGFKSY